MVAHSAQTQAKPQLGYLTLAPIDILLVKFNFGEKNFDYIPAGIEWVDRPPDYQVDVIHQQDALRAGADKSVIEVGRVREGRVDTGEQVLSVNRPVQAAMLRRGLINNGFRLSHLHAFKRANTNNPRKDNDPRKELPTTFAMNAVYTRGITGIETTAPITEALRQMAKLAWSNSYLWDNGPGKPATINFAGCLQFQPPKKALVVREGRVVAIDVAAPVTEEDEDADSAGDSQ